ncbi:MAG TPA: DUF6496 domain-containing protein [Candidatus Saccharimonadia bacterium]|nr:DUF6496 domain-containing protein [Candidatus Saccharimonadia bacterium]
MAKYDKKAQEKVRKTMHEHKHEGKFKNRKQAIVAGLNIAREEGSNAPKKGES